MNLAFASPGTLAPAVLPDDAVALQGLSLYRFASAGYATRGTDTPAHTLYPPRLIGDVEIGQSAIDAVGLGGRVSITVGDIDLWNADRALADPARYGTSDGRTVTIRTADVLDPRASDAGTSLASSKLAWAGIVRSIDEADSQRIRLSVVDIAERLATPLQTTRYGGTGGMDGPAGLKGKPKPVALGRLYNVDPVPLGNIDLGDGSLPTYQTHWRAVVAHDAVRIRGVAQTAVGSVPSVGQYRDWPAQGAFQIGSTPDGAVTADVRGDTTPVYASSIGGIIRRLVQSLGPLFADAEISADAFAFGDTDIPGEMGWYRNATDTTAASAVEEILAGSGAILAGGRGGLLRLFDPLASDAAQFTLQAPHLLALAPQSVPAGLRPLPRAVAVDWRRNWAPSSDLAGSVPDTERAQLAAAASGPARAESVAITARVAQQREMRLAGLYWSEADALARAQKWRAWLEAGPRVFQATTDRYLGQIECGDIGRLVFPAYGLDTGARVVVVGWREALAARRLTLTLITLPEA
jgi:hypothetical protein